MRKQQSVCKIYYFPSLDGGGFKEVPTVEYQQPEKSIEEKLMDIIGWSVVCVVIGVGGSVIFNQIIMWVARWLGWWPS
jgi:hypothetical protein